MQATTAAVEPGDVYLIVRNGSQERPGLPTEEGTAVPPTILLAKVLGIFLVIVGVTFLLRRHYYIPVFAGFVKERLTRTWVALVEILGGLVPRDYAQRMVLASGRHRLRVRMDRSGGRSGLSGAARRAARADPPCVQHARVVRRWRFAVSRDRCLSRRLGLRLVRRLTGPALALDAPRSWLRMSAIPGRCNSSFVGRTGRSRNARRMVGYLALPAFIASGTSSSFPDLTS